MSVKNDLNGAPRPGLILAHPDASYNAAVSRAFRRLHTTVRLAADADEVRRLVRRHVPELVVLAAELPGESGWLTCNKLRGEFPDLKVVLVADEPTAYLERFARFVGAAALLSIHSAPAALVELAGLAATV